MKNDKKSEQYRNEGNAEFKRGKFYEALIAYNKSLCFAEPQKSKNLALAYANRSAAYLEIEQPDKCLDNIKLARAAGYPNEGRLKHRENRCLKLKEAIDREAQVQDPGNDPADFFKLSYPANEKIPSVVDCLEIWENARFGRHIVTTRDLHPGDVIANEEPIFKAIRLEGCYIRCTNCLKPNMLNLIPHGRSCSYVMFCDQKCSDEAQQRFPDLMPGGEVTNPVFDENETDLLWIGVLRILYESLVATGSVRKLRALMKNISGMRIQDFDFRDIYGNNQSITVKKLQFFSLVMNERHLDSDKTCKRTWKQLSTEVISTQPSILKFINSQKDRNFIIDFGVRMALFLNVYTKTYGYVDEIHGTGVFPFCSFFNHSCDPNVGDLIHENDKKIIFVALKPIKKNKPLSVTYGPPMSVFITPDLTTRQQLIYKDCNFICSCDVCKNNFNHRTLPILDMKKFIELSMLPYKTDRTKDLKDVIKDFKESCDYMKKHFKGYPSLDLCRVHLLNIIYLKAMEKFMILPISPISCCSK